ncbi:MAG: Gfo/Idh/MocA family oxidoreductase [Symploca sp. SIO2G7]|nr:Gfo/Idh/MocA family oxidoreductase [Symploca sp. SIO2G7]
MKRIGIAVLGAGRWGTHLIRIFWEHPDAYLVGVVDPHPERLAAVQESFLLNGVVLAKDWESLRAHPEIEAVAIATPAVTHYHLITDALRQGYHVLAEKPLTLNVAECLELCHLAEQQNRLLMVDHTYLFHPAVKRGKEVIQLGYLGELRYGYAARTHLGPVRYDVDAMWDLAIHDIAIFNNWLEQLPVQVQATGRVWLPRDGEMGRWGDEEDKGDKEDEENISSNKGQRTKDKGQILADLVQVTLTYASGFQAFIHLCWLNPDKQRRLTIVGEQGSLIFNEMDTQAPLIIQRGYLEQQDNQFTPAGQSREVLAIESTQPLGLVCDRFLHNIRTVQPSNLSSGWVGAQLVNILCCLSQSLQQGGQPITVETRHSASLNLAG